MINFIDNFLNKITMYRLTLYSLLVMIGAGLGFSFLKILPFDPLLFSASSLFILFVCYLSNIIFSRAFKAATNVESVYITASILMLIISPPSSMGDTAYWWFLFWVSLWAMASKYIFAIGKKHIFNPAAFAVALAALTINQSASWWIGTPVMAPLVILCGLLISRKLRRFDLVLTFFLFALASIIGLKAFDFNSGFNIGVRALFYSPLFFFGFIMLTEPLTAPPTKVERMIYAALAGMLFSPVLHIGPIYSTPELSLLFSNIFAYFVSPKQKLILKLRERVKIANSTYDFIFDTEKKLNFKAGQYLEWTLGHKKTDSRGNRRYFTISSSPTEEHEIRIGVKFYPEGSSFKNNLLEMKKGETIVASQLAGEFTLPQRKDNKLVFLAGGIGITPFRSMIKYLMDNKEQRDIIMLYSNITKDDIAYKNIIDEAQQKIGVRVIYTLTGEADREWGGETGFINEKMIREKVPDYKERHFYISGTHGMVVAFEDMLNKLGVAKSHIKRDFFPGFA